MSERLFTADWAVPVPTAAALELGDPFEAKTWFSARQHACATLGLDVHQVRVREVDAGYEPRDIDEVVEGDDEQASGVRLRLVKDQHWVDFEDSDVPAAADDPGRAEGGST